MTIEEFEIQLKKKYPNLYNGLRNKKSSQGGYLMPIAFGIECGEGWYNLIDYVSAKLEALNQKLEVVQIKEKWGSIRLYLNISTDEADKIVEFVEKESETTCEICSKKGKLLTDGWWKVRCHSCLNK